MPAVQHVSPKKGNVLVLVGTMKGAFVFCSDASRKRWKVGGPYSIGSPVYAMAYDGRDGRHRLWWAQQSFRWGCSLVSSEDYGKTTSEPERYSVKFPEASGLTLKNIWQIHVPAAKEEKNTLYCGVEPSALFVSRDAGQSWSPVNGLLEHPHRAKWTPGGGGQCLHTIAPHPSDPQRMIVAMSTGGAYRTTDGGNTWQARNQGIRAEFMPEKYPEFGQCVHKIARDPQNPNRLYLQNHWGLYRSDDDGDTWKDIAKGVPSDFGFAMVAHPHDTDTAYIVPIESDEYRCTPEGKLRVYRTRNGGKSWEPLTRGLPQKNALETILRDSMAADSLHPAGVYFGTRSGKLYGSSDDGKSWQLILEGLPPVVCVKTAIVGDGAASSPRKHGGTEKKRSKKKTAAKKSRRK
jgi:photosystem II stability/assembly factor-like uncharacterized protein